jgi:signal transduction histidine kinase
MLKDAPEISAPPLNLTDKSLIVLPKRTHVSRETLQWSVRITSLTLSLTVAILLIDQFLLPLIGVREPFLLFLLGVAFISWYVGFRAGILMIVFSSLVINYFLLPPYGTFFHPVPEFISWFIYILSAVAINFIIEHSKHPAIITKYEKREKEYQQLLLKLHKDYLTAKDEIRARDEFLSIASHELKTPLSAMLLQLQTVLHNVRNVSLANFSVENLLKMLDSAEQQSRRLSKMINDLLNVSLITTGKLDLEKEPMNLSETVIDCVERISEKAKKDGIRIQLHTKENINGNWDKVRIEQAVSNLLTNALKYGDGNPVEVTTVKQGDTAKVIVKDHGIGIPAHKHSKIFARFERAVQNDSIEGLGVGLYITQQIVQAHEGKIEVESKEHKGSTFTISLPMKE